MNNWKPYNLEQLAYYYNGMAFKPDDWKEEGIKIIRIEQLNNPTGHYDYYQGEVSENNGINNEDLIFSWSATLKVAIWKHGYGVLNQHLFKVVPKDIADKYFLYYLLDANMEKLGESSHGLTMKHIKRGELEKYIVSIPEIPEQQCIAKILSTANAVIEKTQAAIAKYKAIKQGMLQDLFTRGIDLSTNKLRPRYEDAPELYKESKLGMIPREWEVEKIGKIFRFNQGVQCPVELQKLHQGENEVRFIRIIDLTNEGEPPRYIADPGSQYHINSNDLFMVRYGSPGLVGYGYEGVIANNLFRIISTGELEILNSFYRYYLTSINDKLTALSASTTMPAINFDSLNKLHVIYPQIFEQVEIEKRIKAIDNKLQTEQNYLQKMQSLKKGLMEDLLCGKKQVKVAEEVLTQSEN